jgi:hypothetical protein
MSDTEVKELREAAKLYLDHADEKVVQIVHDLLAANEPSDLTPEQEVVLDERMKKYKNGEMVFSSWEEVWERISARVKSGRG